MGTNTLEILRSRSVQVTLKAQPGKLTCRCTWPKCDRWAPVFWENSSETSAAGLFTFWALDSTWGSPSDSLIWVTSGFSSVPRGFCLTKFFCSAPSLSLSFYSFFFKWTSLSRNHFIFLRMQYKQLILKHNPLESNCPLILCTISHYNFSCCFCQCLCTMFPLLFFSPRKFKFELL